MQNSFIIAACAARAISTYLLYRDIFASLVFIKPRCRVGTAAITRYKWRNDNYSLTRAPN